MSKIDRDIVFLRAGDPEQLRKDIMRMLVEDKRWRLVAVYHDKFYHVAWLEFEL